MCSIYSSHLLTTWRGFLSHYFFMEQRVFGTTYTPHLCKLILKYFTYLLCMTFKCFYNISNSLWNFFSVKEDLMFLMKSKYGHFLALKLMKHSTQEQKDKMFEKMQPHIVSLLRHQHGSTVVSEFYSHHGSAIQKSAIIKDCYGPLMRLEKVDQGLTTVLEKFPERKTMILQSMQDLINFMVEK